MQRSDIQAVKSDIKTVHDRCKQLENKQIVLEKHKDKLYKMASKILEPESRSIRENLMCFFFFFFEEQGSQKGQSMEKVSVNLKTALRKYNHCEI